MKTRNLFLTLVLLAAVGALFGATHASAIKEADPIAFGMFGLTQAQTARLNLVNLTSSEFVPCVRVELSFIDAEGRTLLQQVHEIERGKSAFLDLSGNQLVSRIGRMQVRALVRVISTPDTVDNPDLRECLAMLELVENATAGSQSRLERGLHATRGNDAKRRAGGSARDCCADATIGCAATILTNIEVKSWN